MKKTLERASLSTKKIREREHISSSLLFFCAASLPVLALHTSSFISRGVVSASSSSYRKIIITTTAAPRNDSFSPALIVLVLFLLVERIIISGFYYTKVVHTHTHSVTLKHTTHYSIYIYIHCGFLPCW